MSSATLKKIKRLVNNKQILLEKVDGKYYITYMQKFKDRLDLKRWWMSCQICDWHDSSSYEESVHIEKNDGWETKFKIGDRWLNKDRIEALDLIIKENENNKINGI